jgi:hypothetical protein
MFGWLRARVGRDRPPSTDQELAEEERIRREAEQELRRAEARRAEERAPLDGHSGGNLFGGW